MSVPVMKPNMCSVSTSSAFPAFLDDSPSAGPVTPKRVNRTSPITPTETGGRPGLPKPASKQSAWTIKNSCLARQNNTQPCRQVRDSSNPNGIAVGDLALPSYSKQPCVQQ